MTPESLLPQSVGIAVDTQAPILISFDSPMDAASVESAFELVPAQPVRLSWNEARTALMVAPGGQWRTDERYLVIVDSGSVTADGASLRAAKRFSFTTVTAPAVTDFQVYLAGPDLAAARAAAEVKEVSTRGAVIAADTGARVEAERSSQQVGVGATSQPPTSTVTKVSSATAISIDFSVPMDRADVEDRFAISPKIDGSLSWRRGSLVFTPAERLQPGARYTISVIGSHDLSGNALGGEGNFSFIVQSSAQVTKTSPAAKAKDADPAKLSMWFTQPMDRNATGRALSVTDTATGARVAGKVAWNEASTQLTFAPNRPFAAGHAFTISLGKGGRDADGNAVRASWRFTTKAPPVAVAAAPAVTVTAAAPAAAPARVVPSAAPATSLAGYALNQVNAARAEHGFRPLVLDSAISAVAAAHAMDQAVNNYFSHTGLDGSSRETRLRRGGVSWDWWTGENQCYRVGLSQQATLNWCHSAFMAEPYPGQWNHIANILNPNARRMGVGIAQVGSKIVIVWDFAD